MLKEERDLIEKRLAQRAAWAELGPEDLKKWQACGYTVKYRAHSAKTFLIWKNTEGEPTIVDVYKINDFQADFSGGLWTCMENEHGVEHEIGHNPSRIGDYNVFVHIPYIQNMQYLPNQTESAYVLRFPLVFRQHGRPRSLARNETYLTDVTDFVSIFPQFADRKF